MIIILEGLEMIEKNWYNLSVEETEKELGTNCVSGLSNEQVQNSRAKYGFNELQAQKKKSLFVKFLEQFKDFMIIILIIAAIVSGVVGYMQGEGITDSIIIFIVIIVNAIIIIMFITNNFFICLSFNRFIYFLLFCL